MTVLCADCGIDIASEWKGEWRRVCCACEKTIHDSCWLTRLSDGVADGNCECGGGWNLWSHNVQVTECYTEDPESTPPNCKCEGG